MNRTCRWLTCLILGLPLFSQLGQAATLHALRVWQHPDKTRIVLESDQPLHYHIFSLHHPERLVVDLANHPNLPKLERPQLDNSPITNIRSSRRDDHSLRIVFDLRASHPYQSFQLKPQANYRNRLVIDLAPIHKGSNTAQTPTPSHKNPPLTTAHQTQKNILIALDAGHGGEDPGAPGPQGKPEKTLVLAVARALQQQLNRIPGFEARLTRKGDYFIPLRQRLRIAQGFAGERGTDLFMSIHADSAANHKARGASVYALSERAASSEAARLLAKKENASDLIGGMRTDRADTMLNSVLLDMAQTGSISASFQLGEQLLKQLGHISQLHKKTVQQAPFAVLKSPSFPAVLVETAFISNREDERRLRSAAYRKKLARALALAIVRYFQIFPPSGSLLSQHQLHQIVKGDRLTQLAQRLHTSTQTLRALNPHAKKLRVGDWLLLPSS